MYYRFSSLILAAAATSFFGLTNVGQAEAKQSKSSGSGGLDWQNATLKYNEPGICETTPGVKSYSGYVELENSINVFFWFIEARKDPSKAPLTLWLNGGPGSSSEIGLLRENGPCIVNEDMTTTLNPYSWNQVSNMLYIDQPVGYNGAGFSYVNQSEASSDPLISRTRDAAPVLWATLQAFYAEFPQYKAENGFNFFTESYGGQYGPIFSEYILEQNAKVAQPEQSSNGIAIPLTTLGIGNGLYDVLTQAKYWPIFANQNSYGIKALSDEQYELATSPEVLQRCEDAVIACRITKDQDVCVNANLYCAEGVQDVYTEFSNRSVYDIRDKDHKGLPEYYKTYLRQPSVLNALGARIPFHEDNNEIFTAFMLSGDGVFEDTSRVIGKLLDQGVHVSMYAGDADYICNWLGNEAVSEAVRYGNGKFFRSTPYVHFTTQTGVKGATRELGTFSFTRIYEAGHEVPYYQPEAMLQYFERAISGQKISDGSSGAVKGNRSVK